MRVESPKARALASNLHQFFSVAAGLTGGGGCRSQKCRRERHQDWEVSNHPCLRSKWYYQKKNRNDVNQEGRVTPRMVGDSSGDTETDDKKESAAATTNLTAAATNFATEVDTRWKTRLLAESGSLEDASEGNHCDWDPGVPKGCQFSPDGTCLLTARANKLELYNTVYDDDEDGEDNQQWKPAITCQSGDSVRNYAWYPRMNSSDPATCCFLGVSRGSPVHLYDAYDGSIRASYRPYNGLDEMESPTVVSFVNNGQQLVTGGLRSDRLLHVFDLNRPGRDHAQPLLKLGKTRRSKDGQKGLVSAMAYSETNGVLAVGTYSPGSIYLYDLRASLKSGVAEIVLSSATSTSSGGAVCLSGHGKKGKKHNNNKRKRFATENNGADSMNFSAAKLQWYQSRTRGGVTQVEFDGQEANYLFSTSRRSNAILQWDLRKLGSSNFCPGIASFETSNDTNQRIEFSLQQDQLWTGGLDGCVRVYSHTKTKDNLLAKLEFGDCVNGVSLHPDPIDSSSNNAQLEKLFPEDSNDSSEDRKPFKTLLAVALGKRHFPSENDWENDNPQESLAIRTKDLVGSTQIHSVEGIL